MSEAFSPSGSSLVRTLSAKLVSLILVESDPGVLDYLYSQILKESVLLEDPEIEWIMEVLLKCVCGVETNAKDTVFRTFWKR
ncbi:hypothetical protein HDU91_003430, partial [Kappamyces sp. JEL0680]